MLDKAKVYFKKIQLKNRQRAINKLYEEEGLTDEVLEAQVELNTLRNELDIPDADSLNDDGFSQ